MQEAPEARIFSHTDGSVAALNAASTSLGSCHFQQLSLAWSSEPQPVGARSARPADVAALLELMRCIALSRICYGDHHWKMTEAHVNLAQGYLQFKGFSLQAQQHAEKAKEILLASSPIPSSDSQQRMDFVLSAHWPGAANRGQFAKHVKSMICVRLSFCTAALCQCQKGSEDAILCYQKALSYIERSKGETNLECIPVHKKMAGVAQVLGIHATAIQHLVKAHFIAMRKSPSSGEAAETAHLVAQAAVASKQSEHKDECLLKVLNSYHAVLLVGMHTSVNAAHWITVDLVLLALFLSFCRLCMTVTSFLKQLMLFSFPDPFLIFLRPFFLSQRAPIMLKGSLEAKISLFGYLSLEVAETYWLLGGTELAQGHTHLAYKKLKKCLYLQILLFGTHNKRTVATQEDIDLSK
ncbi:LOW QUALITY PROTEIN: tetratricopeptide repeat protein 23 [Gopherus evgoodei]|uniref:LOW QUALITY PROTEIN: tetratricopeptide repeat protein 23 n=1 Tax=Gopherus evgoodei TaxID=1825980 RepID=UPI0011CF3E35|nr:LOW QUALITY PROTEIN: tetratricopeptide repeat protein 23 [Gopherus evgoodei]